jgi:glycosyltransferase involved in cell wall biosynthesis
MKIAFVGPKHGFDYYQIGGVESFARRITPYLIKNGNTVDYIVYGNKENKEIAILPGWKVKYLRTIENSFQAMDNQYDHVITIYIPPQHRLKYALFRKENSHATRFHFLYLGWPDLLIKRLLYFYEARLFPYNGKLFCVSKRQYEYIGKWAKNAIYVLPPVPESYFLEPADKPNNTKIKVAFLGRVDIGKGLKEVIDIFKELTTNAKFECSLYGIRIPKDNNALKLHSWLKNQDYIKYVEIDRQNYSVAIEEMVKNILRETDMFLIPYKKLSSTMDTPLTILEAMANLCVIITKPLGNIPDVCGKNKFIVPRKKFTSEVINLLNNVSIDEIAEERLRIYNQNKKMRFKTEEIAKEFNKAFNE